MVQYMVGTAVLFVFLRFAAWRVCGVVWSCTHTQRAAERFARHAHTPQDASTYRLRNSDRFALLHLSLIHI